MDNEIHIQAKIASRKFIYVHIVGEYENSIRQITDTEAIENLEATIQIVEGYSYEFKIEGPYSLKAEGGVISISKLDRSQGRIIPGIYVGTLSVFIVDDKTIYS